MIERKEEHEDLAIFPMRYLSVGATLAGRGIVLQTRT
jgi:hypothetical protein